MKLRMDRRLTELLDASGYPWHVEPGSRHYKIRLGGRLATCYPKGTGFFCVENALSQVKRVIKELQQS